LYTEGLPDPDLLSAPARDAVSNFLLWQIAVCEIFVTETLWRFQPARLLEALLEFQKRERPTRIREGEPSDENRRALPAINLMTDDLGHICLVSPAWRVVSCSF